MCWEAVEASRQKSVLTVLPLAARQVLTCIFILFLWSHAWMSHDRPMCLNDLSSDRSANSAPAFRCTRFLLSSIEHRQRDNDSPRRSFQEGCVADSQRPSAKEYKQRNEARILSVLQTGHRGRRNWQSALGGASRGASKVDCMELSQRHVERGRYAQIY